MNKPEFSHDKNQWIAYALFLEDSNTALKSGTQPTTTNIAMAKVIEGWIDYVECGDLDHCVAEMQQNLDHLRQ